MMKAHVYVTLKASVLDPQGQTIQNALRKIGYGQVDGVRQGKYFDIDIAPGTPREEAAREMNQIAHDVLANPVMEDYQVELME